MSRGDQGLLKFRKVDYANMLRPSAVKHIHSAVAFNSCTGFYFWDASQSHVQIKCPIRRTCSYRSGFGDRDVWRRAVRGTFSVCSAWRSRGAVGITPGVWPLTPDNMLTTRGCDGEMKQFESSLTLSGLEGYFYISVSGSPRTGQFNLC